MVAVTQWQLIIGEPDDPITFQRSCGEATFLLSLRNWLPIYQTLKQPTSPMRVSFVLVLLVATQVACYNGFANAEGSVEAKTLHTEFGNNLISGDTTTHRNLKGSKKTAEAQDATEEERGLEFLSKLTSIFKKNPSLGKQVEKMQKNPSIAKSLQKVSVSDKVINNVRTYFGRLSANSSPIEKGFIIATILLFIAGGWVVLKS